MSARNLLISIACFFLLINIRSAFVNKSVYGAKNAGYGSYGVTSTKFMPNESSDPKVFFMGNSVYYGTDVIPQISNLQATRPTSFQIGNFGFTGASIYDYIHNYEHLKKFSPDLIIVQFNPTSFGYAGPYYRNDGYKNSFSLSRIGLYSEEFIRKTVSKDDLAEIASFSYVPLVRTSKLDRTWCNLKLKSFSRKISSLRLWTFFPNKLNAVGEWATNRKKANTIVFEDDQDDNASAFDPSSGPTNKQEYKTIETALKYFISQLNRDKQKAIFIIQPSGFPKLPIMDKMESLLAKEDGIHFVDNHDYFVDRLYIDKIHPNLEGAKLAAERHYKLIENQLN